MAFVMRALALLALMPAVSGAYSCPSGYADRTGTPKCLGLSGDTCSLTQCCTVTGTLCSATNVISGNSKCKAGSDTNKFFDLHKAASVVSGDSDDDFRAACCSACSAATCADWQTAKPFIVCGTGKMISGITVLASSDCSIPVDADYKETCCVTRPITCSATNVISGNSKCKVETLSEFFDLKKATSVVSSDSATDFKSACCSACSAATCADWQTAKPLTGCGTGKMLSGTTALASSDCSVPDDDAYRSACCRDAMTCAAYTGDTDPGTDVDRASPLGVIVSSALSFVVLPLVF